MGNDIYFGFGNLIDFFQKLCSFMGHNNEAIASLSDLTHNLTLLCIWFAQHCMESCYYRHTDLLEKGQQMAAGGAAIDAELVLYADDIDIIEIQKICCAPVGVYVFLRQLEPHPFGIVVSFGSIIDSANETIRVRRCGRYRLAEIVGERGYPAAPGYKIADEGDAAAKFRIYNGVPFVKFSGVVFSKGILCHSVRRLSNSLRVTGVPVPSK